MADRCFQIRHLHRRQRRLQSLVAHLQTGAIDRLLQGLTGQDSECMWHPSLKRRLPNAARNFVDDHVVVRRVAAQQTANANHRVVLFRLRERASGYGNLKCAGHANQRDILLVRSRAEQPVVCALKKPLGDEGIEARHNNRKPFSDSAEAAFDHWNDRLGRTFDFDFPGRSFFSVHVSVVKPLTHRPLNAAARFSKNAAVPSALSEVAQQTPNKAASRNSPSAKVISIPWLTASMAYCTASGAFAMIFPAIASARGISSAAAVTSFTNPIRCASGAVIISPASTICIASPLPTSRGSRCVPPYPGIIPSFTSGCPSLALSLARRIVQARASSHPPPSANPLMQAITGLPRFSIRSSTACPRCAYSLPETASCFASSPMSAPATKAFSPAPVKIATRIEVSFLISRNAVPNSSIVAMLSALSTFGRLTVT